MNGKEVLLSVTSEVFGRPVDPADTLFDLGADSLSVVELSLRLEEKLGRPIDVGWLMSGASLETLAADLPGVA